jgi:hypothetical protein
MASFLDALQDMKDTQRMIEAAKTGGLFAVLDAQQKMRERQQLRDLAANSDASLGIQREAMDASRRQQAAEEVRMQQARLEAAREQARLKSMADALAVERERQELEKKRRDSLPKCPDCHSPIEGDQPRKCAACRSELFWLRGNPLAHSDAMSVANSGWLIPEIQRCREQLTHVAIELAVALCIVRDSGITDVAACKDVLAKRTLKVQLLEKQASSLGPRLSPDDPLLQRRGSLEKALATIKEQIAVIKSRQSQAELDFSPNAPTVRARLQQEMKALLAKAAEIAPQLNSAEDKVRLKTREAVEAAAIEKQKLGKQIEAIRNGPPELAELQAVCAHARTAEVAVASVADVLALIEPLRRSLGGTSASMPSVLEMPVGVEGKPLPASASGDFEVEIRLPSDAVAQRMNVTDARTWLQQAAIGVEVVRAVGTEEWIPARKAFPEVFVAQQELSVLERLLKSGVPAQSCERPILSEDAIVDLLLPGMCAIAAADGVLQSQERKLIVDLLREKGCSADPSEIDGKVTDTCKRIHKQGVQATADQLCRGLEPFVGRPLCDLFLELLDRIAAADGRVGNRESAVLGLFRHRLTVS